jgi:hypothetical protein
MATPEPDSPDLESKRNAVPAAEIARAWGTSRAYVSKCIKKGCPTDSIESASAWRAKTAKYGVGYRSKGAKTAAPEPAPEPETVEKRLVITSVMITRDLTSVDQSLEAAVEVEQEAHRLVMEAHRDQNDDLLAVRIQSYNKARDGRLQAEKMVVEYREKVGQLISLDAARALIQKAWGPHINRLRALPKRAALKVNPADDVRAEGVLVDEIESVIAETRREFEA